ncbi:MAG: radical SAM protein [Acetobacteraceae bacterium]|nr:radical SAM protein [Acetobacteraceae bacterium]
MARPPAWAKRDAPPPGFDPGAIAPPPLPHGPWRVDSLALDVSGSCNLACRYCAEGATQPRRPPMAAEILDAAWEFLARAGSQPGPSSVGRRSREWSLRFGSGEPLLRRDLLQRAAGLIGSACGPGPDRPAVFLTTNGVLLDDETCRWLAQSGWHVKVSLDGPPAVHDSWRVTPAGRGTYTQAASAVSLLTRLMPERLSVTAVLCAEADPAEVFGVAEGLGVRRIELVPVSHEDARVRPSPADIERYQAFVLDYARRHLEGPPDQAPPVLIRFALRVARAMGHGNSRVACAAGRSFLGVGPDGGLYPCFRFIGIDGYRLGSLGSGVDQARQSAFCRGPGRPYDRRTPCGSCWAAPLCGGPCFACAEMFGPGEGRPEPHSCAYVRADARAAVWLVGELRRRDRRRLLRFLPGVEGV